jgi:hypothetical protein
MEIIGVKVEIKNSADKFSSSLDAPFFRCRREQLEGNRS